MQMTARIFVICIVIGGEASDETTVLICIASPGDGGLQGGALLVVAMTIAVTLYVVMVVVDVITLVVAVMRAGPVLRLIRSGAAAFRRKELLGRAGQDVPVLGGRPGVPHGTRPVRRPRRAPAAGAALSPLDGTGLELGLLLLCGARLRRVGDAAARDGLLVGRRPRRPHLGLGVALGVGVGAVSEVALHHQSQPRVVVRRRRSHAGGGGEVGVDVVWQGGEPRAALAEHGLR